MNLNMTSDDAIKANNSQTNDTNSIPVDDGDVEGGKVETQDIVIVVTRGEEDKAEEEAKMKNETCTNVLPNDSPPLTIASPQEGEDSSQCSVHSIGNHAGADFVERINSPALSAAPTSRPGAYCVENPSFNPPAPAVGTRDNDHIMEADAVPVLEAYKVQEEEEEGEVPHEAQVINTIFGIDRKRFFIMVALMAAVIAIILGVILGFQSNGNPTTAPAVNGNIVCGSICNIGFGEGQAEGVEIPFPERIAFGKTCLEWDMDARTKPQGNNTDCSTEYSAVAHSCGCSPPIPTDYGCGTLCQDGSEITNPELLVVDILHREFNCRDFESKSLFERDDGECPYYNPIGVVCGCEFNTPDPDACGPLCENGAISQNSTDSQFSFCRERDIYSKFLPRWYNPRYNPRGDDCTPIIGLLSQCCNDNDLHAEQENFTLPEFGLKPKGGG